MSNYCCHLQIDIGGALTICVFSLGTFKLFKFIFEIFLRFSNFLLESIKPAVKMDELSGSVEESDEEEMMEQV